MKKIALLILILFSHLSWAQDTDFLPNTGDNEMDIFLKKVNSDAKKDVTEFKNMVTNKFNIAKKEIEKLLLDMLPGDVYMAAQVSKATGKSLTEVSSTYKKNKGKGWGVIAKELGIKPGSPEFHALKKSMKKSGGKNKEGKGKGKNKEKKEKDK